MVRSRSGVGALLLTGLVLVPGAIAAQDARLDESHAAATIRLSARLAGPVSGEHPEAGSWQDLLARSAAGRLAADEAVCDRLGTGSMRRDRAGRRVALRVVCIEGGLSSASPATSASPALPAPLQRPASMGSPASPALLTLRVEAF